MANRRNFYYRQLVTEAELDSAFEQLEQADRDIVADLLPFGIAANAEVTEHSPVPDMTVDVGGGAIAYDQQGRRITIPSRQIVDMTRDSNGAPTEVAGAGHEKWVSVFVRFKRALSDLRMDGNGDQVYFASDESFELIKVQAPEGAPGTTALPGLRTDALLLADVRLRFGQTAIANADIDMSRRQDAFIVEAGSMRIRGGRVKDAIEQTLTHLNHHVQGTANPHPAKSIEYGGGPAWADGTTNPPSNVEAQLDKIVADLVAPEGADRISAPEVGGTTYALTAGSIKRQLSELLGHVNDHANLTTGAHPASAITYPDPGTLLGVDNVNAAIASLAGGVKRFRTVADEDALRDLTGMRPNDLAFVADSLCLFVFVEQPSGPPEMERWIVHPSAAPTPYGFWVNIAFGITGRAFGLAQLDDEGRVAASKVRNGIVGMYASPGSTSAANYTGSDFQDTNTAFWHLDTFAQWEAFDVIDAVFNFKVEQAGIYKLALRSLSGSTPVYADLIGSTMALSPGEHRIGGRVVIPVVPNLTERRIVLLANGNGGTARIGGGYESVVTAYRP